MKQEIDYHTTSLEMILLKTFSPVFCPKLLRIPQKCLPLRRQMRNMTSKRNGAFV